MKYENRPFKNVEEMNETLIKNWNDIVKPEDNIYILGDIGMGKPEQIVGVLKRLKGSKFLIKGNHDRISKEINREFKWVKDYFKLKKDGNVIILCHYPIAIWDNQHYNSIHLYGHVHSKPGHISDWKPALNSYNVGCDVNNFTPITFEQILKKLKEGNNIKDYKKEINNLKD